VKGNFHGPLLGVFDVRSDRAASVLPPSYTYERGTSYWSTQHTASVTQVTHYRERKALLECAVGLERVALFSRNPY
jgi:hypothetical protein